MLRLEGSSGIQRLSGADASAWQRVDTLVGQPGQQWYGPARAWKDRPVTGGLSVQWTSAEQEPWYLLSDLPAGAQRIATYRLRMRVEATFQDTKGRGWDLAGSRVRDLARLERLLLGLAVALWWTTQSGPMNPGPQLVSQCPLSSIGRLLYIRCDAPGDYHRVRA